MQKSIIFSGIVSINIFLYGALMKMLHYPGAGIMIMTGLGLTAFLFLPAVTLTVYKDADDKRSLWVYLSGFICAFICIIGAMFKIQHLPGANILLLIGIPVPFVFFLPVYVYHHVRRGDRVMKGFLGVMFLMTYIAVFSALMAVRH